MATSPGRDGAGDALGPSDGGAGALGVGVAVALGAGALGDAGAAGAATVPIGWTDTQRPSHAIRIPA